jgi:predicted O-methyltransferase YrrM
LSKIDHDYISEGFDTPDLKGAFAHRVIGDKQTHPWVYLRREVPHLWYVDERDPLMGFLSLDEVSILYTLARCIPDAEALEIGCHRGWSTAHLAAGVKHLDVVDPVLADSARLADIETSMERAGVRARCSFHEGSSPAAVVALAAERKRPWSLIFIDGDHEPDGPLLDARTVAGLAAKDAMVLFHDLASPVVAEGFAYMRAQGWSCLLFQTMQIMGVAWRGSVNLPVHVPDREVAWTLPDHLRSFDICGEDAKTRSVRLHRFFVDYSSSVQAARARAPLPVGAPTAGALPSNIGTLRDDLLAQRHSTAALEARVGQLIQQTAEKDARIIALLEQVSREKDAGAEKDARIIALSEQVSREKDAGAEKDARIIALLEQISREKVAASVEAQRQHMSISVLEGRNAALESLLASRWSLFKIFLKSRL